MKTNYREMTITTGSYGFNVETINCFGCRSLEQAKQMIDLYWDGDSNPQCRGL